jgi:ribosomal-protein-alanine N-acetyltransferase
MRYITGGVPWAEAQIQTWAATQAKLYRERGFCRWKITGVASGEMLGFCGPGMWKDHPDPEIGWWLKRSHWGRGLATEAARAALDDAFQHRGIERLISVAMPENVASIAIMKKIGLTFDAEFESQGLTLVRYAIARGQLQL